MRPAEARSRNTIRNGVTSLVPGIMSVCTLLCLLHPTPATATGLTAAEVLQMRQVASAALSHDGKLAAYTVLVPREADEDNGADWQELYVLGIDKGFAVGARPFLTGQVNVSALAFSPDDRFLAFRTKRGDDEHTQVWVIPVDGGEARKVTASKTSVISFRWSPDGNRIAYVAKEPPTAREKKLKKKGYLPRYYEENLKPHTLYLVSFDFAAEPADGEAITENISVWQHQFLPDGRRMVITVTEQPLTDQNYMFQQIHLLDLDTGRMEPLLTERAGKLGTIKIGPRGRYLAYTGAHDPQDHASSQLYLMDLERAGDAHIQKLTPPDFEGHLAGVTWRDDKTLLYLAQEGVWTTVNQLGLGMDPARRKILLHAVDTGIITDLPRCRPGVKTMVFLGHTPGHPRELFAWSGKGEPTRLTDSNPHLAERELGEQRVIRYAARDGLEIEGILILPVGYTSGETFPLVVEVHGGPESCRSHGWLTRYSRPGQVAAARGYGVFHPNYRGSTGRGLDFARSAHGDPAGKEYDDIADGITYLIEQGLADPERIGLYGGSYGGYAANWFATHYTHLVKAVVSFVGISDLVSKRFLTDIPYEDEYVHLGKPVREQWDLMRERSPITYAEHSRTAVLLLHGESDSRVHPSQSQEMYRALKMSGHPAVRLIYYPGEGHGNRKRAGRHDAMFRILEWFDWYVRDLQPWDGPLPRLDISDTYGLELEDAQEDAQEGTGD